MKKLFKIFILSVFFVLFTSNLYAEDFTGTWNLYYDWSCDGTYSSYSFTLNTDGTFDWGALTGTWDSSEANILLRFDVTDTTYSGTKVGKAMTGMMINYNGSQEGCWYAIKSSATATATKNDSEQFNSLGKVK